MKQTHFLQLADLVLAEPLPSVVAILIVLATAGIGRRIASRIQSGKDDRLDRAAGFILASAGVAAVSLGAAWSGWAFPAGLRWLGRALAVAGAFEIPGWISWTRARCRQLGTVLSESSSLDRIALAVAAVTAGALGAAALAPPTDADSLDYHLGVPLDWIRHGAAYPRPDWFCARLTGLGEGLNLLGLAAGTDVLSAIFQFSGLVAAVIALSAGAKDRRGRILAALLVVSCPLMLFLVPNQKPQLLPAAALTVALALIVRSGNRLDAGILTLAIGATIFAIACKYSFLLSGLVVLALTLTAARHCGRLITAVGITAAAFSVFALPVYARSFAFYGDPLSPLLERFRGQPDPAVMRFAEYLRDYSGPRSFGRWIRLPLDLTATIHPADFSTMLGLGVFAGVAAFGNRGKSRVFLAAAFLSTILIAAFGQLSARFFLEPYLWAGAAAVAALPNPRKALLLKALSFQGAATAIVAVGMAAILIPGVLSNCWRDRVMTAHANGYAEARWLDRTLRDSDVVLAVFRSSALIPRPFVGSDAANYSAEPFPKNIFSLARSSRSTVLVVPVEGNLTSTFSPCAVPDSPVRIFRSATRNPFKRAPDIQAQIFRLIQGDSRCAPTSEIVGRR